MGYSNPFKLKIDLSEMGTDQAGNPFFVEIRNPRLLTFGQKMEFAEIKKIEDEKKQVEAIKGKVKGLIISWNLLDVETEEPVDVTKDDALEHVPADVVQAIFQELSGSKADTDQAAKDEETKNLSEQSGKS